MIGVAWAWEHQQRVSTRRYDMEAKTTLHMWRWAFGGFISFDLHFGRWDSLAWPSSWALPI